MSIKNFKCSMCGFKYSDTHNFTSCPNCGGLGKPDPKCTCRHYHTSFGQVLNIIAKEDPECPVHSRDISKKK